MEAGVQFELTISPVFVDFKDHLRACAYTGDLFLVFDNAKGGSLSDEYGIGCEFDIKIFKELIATVEQIRQVKRYSVHVGRFDVFACREAGQMWCDPGVLRIHREMPWWRYEEKYSELLEDLHIQG